MATLADINSQLAGQKDVLEDTQKGIKDISNTVQKQLSFFTKGKFEGDDLESQRETRRAKAVGGSIARGGIGQGAGTGAGLMDFLRGLMGGVGAGGLLGFLGGLATNTFTALKRLLRGGAVLALFPFISNFADDLSEGLGNVIDDFLEGAFNFDLTPAQEQTLKDSLSTGIQTGIIAKLFGLRGRTALIAGVIGAAFTAVGDLFPDFGEYSAEKYTQVMNYLRSLGPGGAAVADYIENNPDLATSIGAILLAGAAMPILKGVTSLAALIVGFAFKKIGVLLAGATLTATGGLVLGGVAVAGGAVLFGYKYQNDEEFKAAVDEAIQGAFDNLSDFLSESYTWARTKVVDTWDSISAFLLGIDLDKVDDKLLREREAARGNIDRIKADRQRAIMRALDEAGLQPGDQGAAAISAAIAKQYDAELAAADIRLQNAKDAIAAAGGFGTKYADAAKALSGNPIGPYGATYSEYNYDPTNDPSYFGDLNRPIRRAPPRSSAMSVDDQMAYSRNYFGAGQQMTPIFQTNNDTNVLQQGDNFIAPMGRTQDMWDPSLRRFTQE